MKHKQNQHIDSLGVISVFLAIGLCVMVSAPIWNSSKAEDFEKTMHRAENLAYQIVEAHGSSEVEKLGQGRVPASEAGLSRLSADAGEIGNDRWGHPFKFKVLRTSERQVRIIVWSLGPNGRPETSDEKLASGQDFQAFEFAGDDVGAIVTMK